MVFGKIKTFKNVVEKTENMSKRMKKLEKQVDSHQRLFSNLYLYHTLEPTHYLQSLKDISYELLLFVDNICQKHDLDWWLDFGTLLGAVRHQDFIPWDDDLDSGMMRQDYNTFIDIVHDEINEHFETEFIKTNFKIHHPDTNPLYRWIQIKFIYPNQRFSFTSLDIFPYDYIKDCPRNDVSEKFHKYREVFYQEARDGLDIDTMLEHYYESTNLSFERQDYFMGGAESIRGNTNRFKFNIFKTDDVLPLKRIPFGPYNLPVPKDYDTFLKNSYGKKYMQIPKVIRDHGRYKRLLKIDNVQELIDESLEIFKEVNRNF